MKKILFCSLVVAVACGYCNVVKADCLPQTVTGARICGSIPTGGPMEELKCKKDDGTYKSVSAACSPSHAPANSGHCIDNTYTKTVANDTACAAKECNTPDYLLYTTTDSRRKDRIPIVGMTNTVASQGRCVSKQNLSRFCETSCTCADDNDKCVLNDIVVVNYTKNVPAYVGEEVCKCVPKEEGCLYTFTGKAKCRNSNNQEELRDTILIPKTAFPGGVCHPETVPEFNTWYNGLTGDLLKWVKDNCTEPRGSRLGNGNESAELREAKSKVDAFLTTIQSQKRDVWKDKDGKFNTARLASDLTAGVVLGTVGGVVSGVVIKKKQVEKGFEALHCTVGGQKIADWGDEFSVGLQK